MENSWIVKTLSLKIKASDLKPNTKQTPYITSLFRGINILKSGKCCLSSLSDSFVKHSAWANFNIIYLGACAYLTVQHPARRLRLIYIIISSALYAHSEYWCINKCYQACCQTEVCHGLWSSTPYVYQCTCRNFLILSSWPLTFLHLLF